MNEENQTLPQPAKSSFWEFVKYAIIALLIVIPFRIFIAQPYIVEGSSSYPTFKTGDYLIVDQLSKRFRDPVRQDFLIVDCPNDNSKFCIKRLIGLPNDTVDIKSGLVTIYNENNKDGLKLDEPYVVYPKKEDISVKLKDNEYFVMGDNRAGSADSRLFGPISKKEIIGRPILRIKWFPPQIDIWPGMD